MNSIDAIFFDECQPQIANVLAAGVVVSVTEKINANKHCHRKYLLKHPPYEKISNKIDYSLCGKQCIFLMKIRLKL